MKTDYTFGDLQDELYNAGFIEIPTIIELARAANETLWQTIERMVPRAPDQDLKKAIDILTKNIPSTEWSRHTLTILVILIAHTVSTNSNPDAGIAQQADAWLAVTKALDEEDPGWRDGSASALNRAVAAIHELARKARSYGKPL